MRVPVFPIVASLALLAAPAFAQNAPMTETNSDQNSTPGYTNNGMTGNGGGYNGTGAYNGGTYNGTTGGYNGMSGAYNNQGARNSWSNGANVPPTLGSEFAGRFCSRASTMSASFPRFLSSTLWRLTART